MRVLLVLELMDLDLDVLLEKVAVAQWQRQAPALVDGDAAR